MGPPNNLELQLNLVREEIQYQRDKRWKIFSWATTILTLFVGAILAVKTDPGRGKLLTVALKISIALSSGAITLFSVSWIKQNLAIERAAKQRYLEILGSSEERFEHNGARFGYVHALGLLFVSVAIALLL